MTQSSLQSLHRLDQYRAGIDELKAAGLDCTEYEDAYQEYLSYHNDILVEEAEIAQLEELRDRLLAEGE